MPPFGAGDPALADRNAFINEMVERTDPAFAKFDLLFSRDDGEFLGVWRMAWVAMFLHPGKARTHNYSTYIDNQDAGIGAFKRVYQQRVSKLRFNRVDVPGNGRPADFGLQCTNEFSAYLDRTAGTIAPPTMTPSEIRAWWKVNGSDFPALQLLARDFATIALSSAAAERVFSILRQLFSSTQRSSHEDYIEASILTRYNQRGMADHE